MEYTKDEYATKDLYLAAFFVLKGAYLLKVEKYGRSDMNGGIPGQKANIPAYFIFGNREACEQWENIFWTRTEPEAIGNIGDYTTILRDLRTRAFSVTKIVDNISNRYESR